MYWVRELYCCLRPGRKRRRLRAVSCMSDRRGRLWWMYRERKDLLEFGGRVDGVPAALLGGPSSCRHAFGKGRIVESGGSKVGIGDPVGAIPSPCRVYSAPQAIIRERCFRAVEVNVHVHAGECW